MEVRNNDDKEYTGKETVVYKFPRSHLYNIIPIDRETPWIESLTSYINRLAWMYRVEPRILVAQEIVPHFVKSYHFRSSSSLLGAFCRSEAMSINGTGETALDWSAILKRLTMCENLRDSTLSAWARNIPSKGLLRMSPAYCPACYHQWQKEGLSIHQPLLWMLQVVTVCLRHRRHLEERCQHCQKKQSVIAAKVRPGCCTQCMNWLGSPSNLVTENEIDDETCNWQEWVVDVIGELRKASTPSGFLPWEHLANGLVLCSAIMGSAQQLALQTGLSKQLLSSWRNYKQTPSFERVLELCYMLDVSPLLLMTNNPTDLKEALQAKEIHRQPRRKLLSPRQVNLEQALALIHAVLEEREIPMAVRQIERRLGLGAKTLVYHFPQECSLVTAKYKAYITEQARKRMEQECNEVRQATITLNACETNPSANRVASRLSNPGVMRTSEGLRTWHKARRELGLE